VNFSVDDQILVCLSISGLNADTASWPIWICKIAAEVPTNVQLVVFSMSSYFLSYCVDFAAKIVGTQKHSKLHRATADPIFVVICFWLRWFLWC